MNYDEELMIKDIESVFKENLNAEIDAINAEKNDALVLEHIPTDKYNFEYLSSRVINYKGFFVMIALRDTVSKEEQENNFIEDVKISVEIGTFDKGEKEMTNILYKLLRYRRALKAVLFKNPDVFRGFAKPLTSGLRPSAFPYDNKRDILTIGLEITASTSAN